MSWALEASASPSGPAEATGTGPGPDAPAPPRIEPPALVGSASVEYPEHAEGSSAVVLQLLIDVEGRVAESSVVSGEEPFASAAVDASRFWLFAPARRNGKAMPAKIHFEVVFTPEEKAPTKDASASDEPAASQPSKATVSNGALAEEDTVEIVTEDDRPVDVKKLGRAEVRQMPGAFGDPFRAVEALPGVTPIVSGLPYFFVRGAPPGNVGYFFDQVQVPLLYHVAAGPGVIHPAFIDSVDLYAGAYPARFGRFSGGIVAGEPAKPEYRLRGEASIRLVDSGAFLEVPFADGRGSAMFGGRYSYTGLIVSLLAPEVTVGYWDYQSKVSYELGPRDRVSVFGFGSHDFLEAENDQGVQQEILDLTFHRLNASHEHLFDGGAALRTTLLFGYERTGLGGDPDAEEEEDPAQLRTRSAGLRLNYEDRLSPRVRLRSGADANFARSTIDINFDADDESDDENNRGLTLEEVVYPAPGLPNIVLDPLGDQRQEQNEDTVEARFASRDDITAGVWLETVIAAAPRVTLIPGLRLDAYKTGDTVTIAPEPRLSARFALSPTLSLTHAVGLAHQPPSFVLPLPGLSGASNDGLQRAVQTSAGIEAILPAKLTATATAFQNVIFDSTDVFGSINLDNSSPSANAFSDRTTNHTYGLELQLKRPLTEKLGGFVAYTLSRSERSVATLHGPSSFDRRHVVNFALAYDLGNRWRLGGRVVAYSGIPAQTAYPGAAIDPPRTPWFYRLDWRLEKRWLIGTDGAWWALVLEALNTTLHKETVSTSCYAYGCNANVIGPVTIPSIGAEASF